MDTVIITGASGEPSLSIARRLCGIGFRVYALAGIVPETGLSSDEFVPTPCDLTNPDSVIAAVQKILAEEPHVSGIVLAEQYLSAEPFEAVSAEEIRLACNAIAVSPLCAVRLALPSLIAARGNVVVVSPGAGTSGGHALNAACNGALNAFAESLFAELRDTGVKTCRILLQNNDGAPDPAARFTTTPQSRIHADIVADAVETVFRLRENNALTQIVLRPQATRETPRIPVSAEPVIRALQKVQLPPAKNFPPEETPIPTPAYRRPDYAPPKDARRENASDDDGFADDYVDPELRYLLKNPNPPRAENGEKPHRENSGNSGNAEKSETRDNGENPRGNENDFRGNARREKRNRRRNRNRRDKKRNFENGGMRVAPPEMPQENPPQQEKNFTNGNSEARKNFSDGNPSREKTPTSENSPLPEKSEIPPTLPEKTPVPEKTENVSADVPADAPAKKGKRPRKPREVSANGEKKKRAPRKPKNPPQEKISQNSAPQENPPSALPRQNDVPAE